MPWVNDLIEWLCLQHCVIVAYLMFSLVYLEGLNTVTFLLHHEPQCLWAMSLSLCQVIKESQLRTIYTAEERYTVKKSTYSNKTISSNSALRPSQFLSMTIDADERRKLEDQLSVRYVIVMKGAFSVFTLVLIRCLIWLSCQCIQIIENDGVDHVWVSQN